MEAAIGYPMEDNGTGTEGMETGRTQTNRIMGAAQDVVWGEAATLGGEDRTGTTAEAEVSEGVVVTTPSPPTKTDRYFWAAFGAVGKEVGLGEERIDWGDG